MSDTPRPSSRVEGPSDARAIAVVLALAAVAAIGLNWGPGESGRAGTVEVWLVPIGLALVGGAIAVALRATRGLAMLAEARVRAAETQAEAVRAVAEAVFRVAEGLKRVQVAPPTATAPAGPEAPPADIAAREALDRGRWKDARRLAEEFAAARPEAPEARALLDEVEARRGEIAGRLRGRLEASRGAADPEGVLEARELLAPLLDPAERPELDRDLLKWLMGLLMRRMRTGTVTADVANLAGTIAETFADTPEGASLRASLPTLRRSAGLCPRCAKPYAGIEDACPECHAPPPGVPAGPTIFPFVGPDGPEADGPEAAGTAGDEPIFREPD